ncbi:MAG: tRNA lysidine(34) synthetase TilS [Treponema sp.]|jgi:tRNA(Ile)-lysidine synthase|nr:tRNA lysidine(34) synthetase TilS [Treponema sp.]
MKLPVDETVPHPSSRFSFEATVASSLGIWAEGTVFLAAVSGGADSTALLTALAAIRAERGYRVHCLHVDHGIRSAEESRGDALAVKNLCASLRVPCRIISIPPGKIAETAKAGNLGIEGAARVFRHQAWNRESRRISAARILVAHTKDDLLETVLMRFLRGSGSVGLAALPKERGQILRPLLALNRSDVLEYLKIKGVSFRTDSTNEDIRYLRNRIRHKLVPCLDTLFPYWKKTVLALAETQRLTAEFLTAEVRQRILWEENRRGGASLCTSEALFFSQPQLIREEAIFQAADRVAVSGNAKRTARFDPDSIMPDRKKTVPPVPRRETIRLFAEGSAAAGRIDAGPIRIEKRGGNVFVSSSIETRDPYDEGFVLLIKEPGMYTLKGLKIVCQFPPPEKKPEVLPFGVPVKLGEQRSKGLGFFAHLPLAFRHSYQALYPGKGLDRMRYSGYTDSITAEDSKGPVACIFSEKDTVILLCREEKSAEKGACISFIIVYGGIDA